MKITLTISFCLIILASYSQDYKISTSRVSVHTTTSQVPTHTLEGQRELSIFMADSIRYYDENSELTDSLSFNKKVTSGEFASYLTYDQTRSIITFSMKEMPKPELEWNNKAVPDFSFKDLNGKIWNQNSIKGKVVVFHFWFTRCGPCVKEFSLLNEFKKRNPDALLFAISFEDPETVRAYLRNHKLDLITIPGQKDLINQLNVKIYPRTFIIDKNRIIKEVLYGPYQDSTLLQSKLDFYYEQ